MDVGTGHAPEQPPARFETRHVEPGSRSMMYREALAIGWRIFWQGLGGCAAALMATNAVLLASLPELIRSEPSWSALAVPRFVATALSLFVIMPLVARRLIRRRFRRFRLDVVRGHEEEKGGARMVRTIVTCLVLATLVVVPASRTAAAEQDDTKLHIVSGTLSKLDLTNGRGLLTTDLGRPVHFEVSKAYLFENVTVGARIAMQLDEYGRAVKVMDTSIPDVIIPPDGRDNIQPLTAMPEASDR